MTSKRRNSGAADCGFTPVFHKPTRIVNGEESILNGWPWIAALGYQVLHHPMFILTNEHLLQLRRNPEGKITYLCGGSLITRRHVLSAAHCIVRADLASVRLGEHNLVSEEDGAEPEDFFVEERIIHAEYHPTTFDNDIGLIKLDRDVVFRETISPVCLPLHLDDGGRDRPPPGAGATVAGWGNTAFRGSSSDILMEITLRVRAESSIAP